MADSPSPKVPPTSAAWRRVVPAALVTLALPGLLLLLQTTEGLRVTRPNALRLVPAPSRPAVCLAFQDLPGLRETVHRPAWSDIVDPALLSGAGVRTTLPALLLGVEAERVLPRLPGALAGDVVVTRDGGSVAIVARVGFAGRAAFNVARWTAGLSKTRRRGRYGSTRGLALLSGPGGEPVLHVAFRGPYAFAATSAEALVSLLALGDGSAPPGRKSLAEVLPAAAENEPAAHLLVATVGRGEPPGAWTLRLEPRQARLAYRFTPREPIPVLPPAALAAPARALPKAAAVVAAVVWPPSLTAALPPSAARVRDDLDARMAREAPGPLAILASEVGRPFGLALGARATASGPAGVPGVAAVAPVRDPPRALRAAEALLRTLLRTSPPRTSAAFGPSDRSVRYHDEGRLGPFAPTLAAGRSHLVLASGEEAAREALAAESGLVPCAADRPEVAELLRLAGAAPASAIAFASGPDLARALSELLPGLAPRLSLGDVGDARDLLAPAVQRFARLRTVHAWLRPEAMGGLVRLDLHFEPGDLPRDSRLR